MNNLQFKISTWLKNIIGKELITNQYVAIFELVKNSYDAYAEKVDIFFDDWKIIIKDDWKWMNLEDIKNKWLFVWYSAKSDNTENINYDDYRKKIQYRKWFAWAKWIGRFACDALWIKMNLITKKEEKDSKIEKLEINWLEFESDKRNNFETVNAKHETLNKYDNLGKNGTIIEISWLYHLWDDKEIEVLKVHLAKLISPFKWTKDDNFKIFFHIKWEEPKPVENFIFEKLGLKTVHISIDIDDKWVYTSTSLVDRWEIIYKIKENNTSILKWISVNLFYLSPSAKTYFNKNLKVSSKDFGSIYVYKNGFRVFPYWEPGEDSFGLDMRKTQWYARYIWTREVIWSIEIDDNDNFFREVTSRDWGFINTLEYLSLKEFILNSIKVLEKYVVDVVDWTYIRDKENQNIWEEIFAKDRPDKIKNLLEKLTNSNNIVDFEYKFDIYHRLEEKSINEWISWSAEKIKKIAEKEWNKEVIKEIKKIEKVTERHKEENKQLQENLEIEKQKSAALEMDLQTSELENILSYYHDIYLFAQNIDNFSKMALDNIREWNLDNMEDIFDSVLFENSKILWISKVALKRGFQENAQIQNRNIIDMIIGYVKEYKDANKDINIEINNNLKNSFDLGFRYYDMVRVLDNLFDNSIKHKSKNIYITFEGDKDILEINIRDDGQWLAKKYLSEPKKIFEWRVSSTNWAWYWLSHVKNVIEWLNWKIEVIPQKEWLVFKINFYRWN